VWTVSAPSPNNPATVTIDLRRAETLAGFSLTPSRAPPNGSVPPRGYHVDTSVDGQEWQTGGSGEFANMAYALATQRIAFAQVRAARFLRLRFDAPAVAGATRVAVAGIGAFTTAQGAPERR
jgi:alpha-L-fucosidase